MRSDDVAEMIGRLSGVLDLTHSFVTFLSSLKNERRMQ